MRTAARGPNVAKQGDGPLLVRASHGARRMARADDAIERVATGAVAKVVAQPGQLEGEHGPFVEPVRTRRVVRKEVRGHAAREMARAEAVLEAAVRRARVHVEHGAQLLDVPESLEDGVIDDRTERRLPFRVAVHDVINHRRFAPRDDARRHITFWRWGGGRRTVRTPSPPPRLSLVVFFLACAN